jgi:hypothetical protein
MNKARRSTREGWARSARPSLCVSALFLALALLGAPSAQALLPTPNLTGTTPESPGIDLEPRVHGDPTGVEIQSVPLARLGVVGFAAEEQTVQLFTNDPCLGAPAAVGTPEDFKTPGIQVLVGEEQTTSIYANQVEGSETSGCSAPLEYKQVKELPPPQEPPPTPPGEPAGSLPPAAPHLRILPALFANDNTPLVTGSAPGATAMRIFADPKCESASVATGSAAQFAAGIPVRVMDNSVTVLYGMSVNAAGHSPCSAPAFYVEDSLAPHVRITMGPAAKTRRHIAVFRFVDVNGDMPGTSYFCKVDRKQWKSCRSPVKLRHLHRRRYVLRVKATDAAGNVETKPAKRGFRVISGP